MESQDKAIEEVCGTDKQCQQRWLESQADCI
jgi:hypothetical protein